MNQDNESDEKQMSDEDIEKVMKEVEAETGGPIYTAMIAFSLRSDGEIDILYDFDETTSYVKFGELLYKLCYSSYRPEIFVHLASLKFPKEKQITLLKAVQHMQFLKGSETPLINPLSFGGFSENSMGGK